MRRTDRHNQGEVSSPFEERVLDWMGEADARGERIEYEMSLSRGRGERMEEALTNIQRNLSITYI